MSEFPETRQSLILQVKNPSNRAAWEEFVGLYRPIIYRVARNRGMQEADAQDLAQQVLFAVASAIGRYEKSSEGVRFRNWLSRVTRNAIIKSLSRAPKERAVGGSAMMELLAEAAESDPATEELISLEYRREIYRRAAEIVKGDVQPESWSVFELTVLGGVPVGEAAKRFRRSVGSIYAVRSRVMRRLRQVVRKLEDDE